jgi:hypothetical protein
MNQREIQCADGADSGMRQMAKSDISGIEPSGLGFTVESSGYCTCENYTNSDFYRNFLLPFFYSWSQEAATSKHE